MTTQLKKTRTFFPELQGICVRLARTDLKFGRRIITQIENDGAFRVKLTDRSGRTTTHKKSELRNEDFIAI